MRDRRGHDEVGQRAHVGERLDARDRIRRSARSPRSRSTVAAHSSNLRRSRSAGTGLSEVRPSACSTCAVSTVPSRSVTRTAPPKWLLGANCDVVVRRDVDARQERLRRARRDSFALRNRRHRRWPSISARAITYCRLNLASSGLSRSRPVGVLQAAARGSTLRCVDVVGREPCVARRARASRRSPGCVLPQHGYCLIAMPGLTMSSGAAQRVERARAS